jgi:peptide/bleomycin uptake transporter
MFREYFQCLDGKTRWFARGGVAVFLLHGVFRAWIKLRLNDWNMRFFDYVQVTGVSVMSGEAELVPSDMMRSNSEGVSQLLREFALIVLPVVLIHPIASFLNSVWVFQWRSALVRSYTRDWVGFKSRCGGPVVEGAAQRIHEDTQRFADGVLRVVLVGIDSVVTLIVFTPLLLELSSSAHCTVAVLGQDGWLLSVACLCAAGGLTVSILVGSKLVDIDVEVQVIEAELRTLLVSMALEPLSGGSFCSDTMGTVARVMSRLWVCMLRLFKHFWAMRTWLSAYDNGMMLLPYMLLSPLLFATDPAHRITLGTLMAGVNAFDKVFASVAVLADNWAGVNEFRSVVRRLRQFEVRVAYETPKIAPPPPPPPNTKNRHGYLGMLDDHIMQALPANGPPSSWLDRVLRAGPNVAQAHCPAYWVDLRSVVGKPKGHAVAQATQMQPQVERKGTSSRAANFTV